MSVRQETARRSIFEKTPLERSELLIQKVLTKIDDPSACKDTESGRYSPLNIVYLEQARDPNQFVRTRFLEVLSQMCTFPESECIELDPEVLRPQFGNSTRAVLRSLSSGNILFEEAIVKPSADATQEPEIWGYQYWISNIND